MLQNTLKRLSAQLYMWLHFQVSRGLARIDFVHLRKIDFSSSKCIYWLHILYMYMITRLTHRAILLRILCVFLDIRQNDVCHAAAKLHSVHTGQQFTGLVSNVRTLRFDLGSSNTIVQYITSIWFNMSNKISIVLCTNYLNCWLVRHV